MPSTFLPRAIARATRATSTSVVACVALSAVLAPALGGCRDRDPNTPIATVSTPLGQGGVVELRYLLRNQDTAGVSIAVSFARVGEAFLPATQAPGGDGTIQLVATPGGASHRFLWDALADLGPGQHSVTLRLVPTLAREGTPGQTGVFTVFNTDLTERLPDLAAPRQRAASSIAPSGGALVTGGAGFSGAVAEHLPQDGVLVERAPLTEPRERHAQATAAIDAAGALAPTVFGGLGGAGALASVERYDAAADAWTLLVPLAAARLDHTATRLGDGAHVLVAGGRESSTGALVATDTVYDARNGGADLGGALTGLAAARVGHTATRLPDGSVLVVGGADASGVPFASSVLVRFDASTQTGTATAGPALVTARSGHAAALVGDTLVVLGGATDAAGALTDTIETLDVASLSPTSSFAVLVNASTAAPARLSVARSGLRALPLGATEVVVAGGFDGQTSSAALERVVVATGQVVPGRQPLAAARRDHEAVPFGPGAGLFASGGTAVVEVYRSPEAITFSSARPEAALGRGRAEHTATLLADGRVLLAGGTDGVVTTTASGLRALAACEVFDPARTPAARVIAAGPLGEARRLHAAARAGNGVVAVFGGLSETGDPLATIERFDAAGLAFTTSSAALPAGRAALGAITLADGLVLLAGGELSGGTLTDEVFLYDADLDTVTSTGALERARSRFALVRLGDGRVLAAGGDAAGPDDEGTCELYDPLAGSWTLVVDPQGAAFGAARTDLAAVLLGSGRVLLAGGRAWADGAPLDRVCVFDIAGDTLTALAPLARPRAGAFALRVGAATGEEAIVAGGLTFLDPAAVSPLAGARTASIERYNAGAGGSTAPFADPDLASPVEGARAVTLFDGTSLVTGGRDAEGAVRPGFERIVP